MFVPFPSSVDDLLPLLPATPIEGSFVMHPSRVKVGVGAVGSLWTCCVFKEASQVKEMANALLESLHDVISVAYKAWDKRGGD